MATSNRDVKLTVEAQALGADSIKNLAAQVRSLGKEGTDAAPEFARLAAELDQIADQSAAINSLKQLEAEVSALAASQANAARIAEGTADAYTKQKTRTDALRATLAESTTAWNVSRNAQAAARQALDEYRATLIGATREEKAADATLRDHTANSAKATGEVRRRKVALDEAAVALRASTKEETAASGAYRKTATELTSATSALRKRTQALADAQGAAGKLGVETADLAAAEAHLRAALTETGVAAQQLQAYTSQLQVLDEMAASAATEHAAAVKRITQAYNEDVAATVKVAEAQAKLLASTKALEDAEQARVARVREQAEADRLAVIQAQGLAEMMRKGVVALQAEMAAQKDAAASTAAYTLQVKKLEQAEADLQARQLQRGRYEQGQRAAAAAASELAALAESERFMQRYAAAQARAASEAQQLTLRIKQAGEAMDAAFTASGVRSVAAIQAEITQTSQALVFLERSFKAGAIGAYDLQRAAGAAQARLQTLQAELTKMPAAVGVFNRMNTAVLDLANRFGALAAALATVGFVAKPILDANLALDSMRRVLTTVYGSAEEAGKQIEFVRRVAETAGLDVLQLGNAFTKFAASAKASGIDAGLVQRVFEATAGAAGNLGLASDKAAHILDALGQMANKGTVSMEELRQQLGDSLPGALSLLAKGLGITEPQLVKLVESGKLLTTEALGPLADAMLSLAAPGGRVEGLRAAMERLGNQFTLAFQKISDTSFYRGLTTVVGGLADNFGALTTGVKLFAEALVVSKVATVVGNFLALRTATTSVAVATVEATTAVVSHTAATGANTVATGANTAAKVANVAATAGNVAAWTAIGAALQSTAAKTEVATAAVTGLSRAKSTLGAAAGRLTTMLGGPVGAVVTLGLAVYELGPSLVRGAAALVGFGDKSDEVASKLKAVEATIRAAAAAREAEGEGLVKAKVQYAEQADALGKASAASEMLAKAIKDTGEASILAAELTGNERTKLLATSAARLADATALETVSVAKRAEADLTAGLVALAERSIEGKGRLNASQQQELDLLLSKRDLLGPLTAAEQERTNALLVAQDAAAKSISSTVEQIKLDRIKLEGQRAAAAEAGAAALKERALADAANFAAEAARNQTGRIRELEQAHRAGQESVDLMRAALARGETTQAAYNATVTRAGQAQGLYRIALDQAAKAGVDLRQAQTGVSDAFFESSKAVHGLITSLKETGLTAEKVGPQLNAALDKQIEAAKTREELEFVKAEVLRARDAFLLLGGDATAALDKITKKAAELSPAMQQAQKDAALLGITLKDKVGGGAEQGVEASLRAYERLKMGGVASASEVEQAFVKVANQAIKAAGGQVPEWVRVEAAIRGVTIAVDASGNAVVAAAGATTQATGQMAAGFRNARSEAEQMLDAIERQIAAEEKQLDLIKRRDAIERQKKGVDINGFATDKAGNTIVQAGPTAEPPTGDGGWTFVNDARVPYRGNTVGGVPSNGMTGFWARTIQGKEADAAKAVEDGAKSDAEFAARRAAGENPGAGGFPLLGTYRAPAAAQTAATAAPAASSGGTRTIRLELGGMGSTSINVASDADAAKVEAFMDQLQAAMARAGG